MPKVTASRPKKKTSSRRTLIADVVVSETQEIIVPKHNDVLHWSIFIIVAVLVAASVIYIGRPDPTTSQASTVTTSSPEQTAPYVPDPASQPPVSQKGIIGTVSEINNDTITIQTIAPVIEGDAVGVSYALHTSSDTQFVYHPLTSDKDADAKTFGTQPGSMKDIKKGMYVSATTSGDINTGTPIEVLEINYSEVSPLE